MASYRPPASLQQKCGRLPSRQNGGRNATGASSQDSRGAAHRRAARPRRCASRFPQFFSIPTKPVPGGLAGPPASSTANIEGPAAGGRRRYISEVRRSFFSRAGEVEISTPYFLWRRPLPPPEFQ